MRVNISAVIILIHLAAVGILDCKVVPVIRELSELHIGENSTMFSFFKLRIVLRDFFIKSAPAFLGGFFRPCGQHVVSAVLIFNALCHTVSDEVSFLIVERILLSFRQDITSFLPCGKLNNTTETLIYPDKFLIFQRIKIFQNINDIILSDSAVSDGRDVFAHVTRGIFADTEQHTDFLRIEEIFSFLRADLFGDSFDFRIIFFHSYSFLSYGSLNHGSLK